MLLQIFLDVAVSLFQMRVDILVFHILKINPLMNLNFMAINFVLDFVMFKCPFVNNGDYTIDTKIVFQAML